MAPTSPRIFCLLLATMLSACTQTAGQTSATTRSTEATPFADAVANEAIMGKWARSCALCHITGEAGAPVVGDTAEWQRRLAKGEQEVIQNVLYGLNSMPPLGYCMSCELSDFRAMVAYMAGGNR